LRLTQGYLGVPQLPGKLFPGVTFLCQCGLSGGHAIDGRAGLTIPAMLDHRALAASRTGPRARRQQTERATHARLRFRRLPVGGSLIRGSIAPKRRRHLYSFL
jgi:hypothetical protein